MVEDDVPPLLRNELEEDVLKNHVHFLKIGFIFALLSFFIAHRGIRSPEQILLVSYEGFQLKGDIPTFILRIS